MPKRIRNKTNGITTARAERSGSARSSDGAGSRGRCQAARQRLAYESARILADDGSAAFDRARRKAAARFGITDKRCWPDNEEIRQALLAHRRLFDAEEHAASLMDLRQHALRAMRSFSAFDPRLVGQALDGTATPNQGVQLWLFADGPEEVALALMERGIPWQQTDDQFRYAGGSVQTHPVFAFVAGNIPIRMVVLPKRAVRNPPLSPVSDRPERGVGAEELGRMIDEGAAAPLVGQ